MKVLRRKRDQKIRDEKFDRRRKIGHIFMYGWRKTVESTILWWINVQTCRMCQKSEEEKEGERKRKKEKEKERQKEIRITIDSSSFLKELHSHAGISHFSFWPVILLKQSFLFHFSTHLSLFFFFFLPSHPVFFLSFSVLWTVVKSLLFQLQSLFRLLYKPFHLYHHQDWKRIRVCVSDENVVDTGSKEWERTAEGESSRTTMISNDREREREIKRNGDEGYISIPYFDVEEEEWTEVTKTFFLSTSLPSLTFSLSLSLALELFAHPSWELLLFKGEW